MVSTALFLEISDSSVLISEKSTLSQSHQKHGGEVQAHTMEFILHWGRAIIEVPH